MELQKEIANLIKLIQWLRQSPAVQPQQLEQAKHHLAQAVNALQTR